MSSQLEQYAKQQAAQAAKMKELLDRAGIDPDQWPDTVDPDEVELPQFQGAEGPELLPGEEQQTRERQDIAAGATPPTSLPHEDPKKTFIDEGRQVIEEGGTTEDALAHFAGRVVDSKDPRVFVPNVDIEDNR